jgi:hypothetical protein
LSVRCFTESVRTTDGQIAHCNVSCQFETLPCVVSHGLEVNDTVLTLLGLAGPRLKLRSSGG